MFTDKYSLNKEGYWVSKKENDMDNDKDTKLEEGDVVVCTFSKNDHFIVGEEYEVISDSCGGYILITKNKQRFSLRPKQAGYCSTNLDNHWFYKKEYIVVIDKSTETKLKTGDTVVCIKSRDYHFIGGKEYKVTTDSWGEPMLITEMSQRYALKPKQGGYCSTNLGEHWFRKKENVMDKEFKAGDWVFEVSHKEGIHLTKISSADNLTFPLRGKLMCYMTDGRFYPDAEVPSLLYATPKNRQALVTMYGEQAVPKLELTGGEAVKHLLKSQKWVLCWVSDDSEAHAREGNVVALIDCADTILPFGSFYDGGDDWDYAVPIDMNGDELTISLVEEA